MVHWDSGKSCIATLTCDFCWFSFVEKCFFCLRWQLLHAAFCLLLEQRKREDPDCNYSARRKRSFYKWRFLECVCIVVMQHAHLGCARFNTMFFCVVEIKGETLVWTRATTQTAAIYRFMIQQLSVSMGWTLPLRNYWQRKSNNFQCSFSKTHLGSPLNWRLLNPCWAVTMKETQNFPVRQRQLIANELVNYQNRRLSFYRDESFKIASVKQNQPWASMRGIC